MSEPEIARRCSACGASIRQLALFCPQCGKPVPQQSTPEREGVKAEPQTRGDSTPTQTEIESAKTIAIDNSATARLSPTPAKNPALNEVRSTMQRATTAARAGFEENVRGPVEKFRKASSVIIDQAAYDPSLRFLLVAAALFVLFVILLILSKIIG